METLADVTAPPPARPGPGRPVWSSGARSGIVLVGDTAGQVVRSVGGVGLVVRGAKPWATPKPRSRPTPPTRHRFTPRATPPPAHRLVTWVPALAQSRLPHFGFKYKN